MKTLIVAEKFNVAAKIAALGRKCFGEFKLSNGAILTPQYIAENEQFVDDCVKKMRKLENDNYVVMFALGHLVELYQAKDYDEEYKNWSKIPVGYVPTPFKFKVKESTKYLFNALKEEMNSDNIKDIIIATDSDREGCSIFAFLYEKANCTKPCKRLWTDAFTESGIEKAFKELKPNSYYKGVEDAGRGRAISDFLMGALLTARATVDLAGNNEILNVGRVQTAVLSEIVRVENLINNFKKVKSYQVVATFKTNKGDVYSGVYDEKFDSLDKANALIKRISDKEPAISDYTRIKASSKCPPLFNQTELAIELANKCGMNPDATMDATQSLYEKGFQTYPRTASRYLTKGDAPSFNKSLQLLSTINPLAAKYPFNISNKNIIDDSKVDSHGAIIPTEVIPDINSLSKTEQQTYNEVVLRAIAVNFPAAIDEKQAITTKISDIEFKSTGKIELERGYREVYNTPIKDNPLPIVSIGDTVTIVNLESKEVETKPPKRYTSASILRFMESCGKKIENEDARELMKNKGIGTNATRADIIKKLFSTKYIEYKGKSKTIYPTEKGMKMIELFPVEQLKNPEFTGNLEYGLYKVEKNEISLETYLQKIEQIYLDACKNINEHKSKKVGTPTSNKKSLGLCPVCREGNIVHNVGKKFDFYGCTNYKNGCKFSISSQICGKKITEAQVSQLLKKRQTTNKISGFKKKDGTPLVSARLKFDKDFKVILDWD